MNLSKVLLFTASLTACVICSGQADETPAPVAKNTSEKASPVVSPIVPRGHWAYEAFRVLAGGGFIPFSPFEEKGDHSRREFAVAVAMLNNQLSDELRLFKWPSSGETSSFRLVAPEEITDIISALRREFADENAKLAMLNGEIRVPRMGRVPVHPPRPVNSPLAHLQKRLSFVNAVMFPGLATQFFYVALPTNTDNLLVLGFRNNHIAILRQDGEIVKGGTYDFETGPDAKGLLLKIYLKDGRYTGAVIPGLVQQKPYWNVYVDALPIDVAGIGTEPKVAPGDNAELVQEHWAYKAADDALRGLNRAGFVEVSLAAPQKPKSRNEFAVITARLLETAALLDNQKRVLSTPSRRWTAALEQDGTLEKLQALAREFSPELDKLGIESPKAGGRHISGHNILHQHVLVELSYGAQTDAALIEKIKETVRAFADENYQTTLQSLKKIEGKP
jgi:hypothetical protein